MYIIPVEIKELNFGKLDLNRHEIKRVAFQIEW